MLSPVLFPMRRPSGLFGGVRAGNVTMHKRATQAMLVAASARLAAGVKTGNGLALHVDHLGTPIDPESTVGIVPHGIDRRRVNRGRVDLVHGRILAPRKIGIG